MIGGSRVCEGHNEVEESRLERSTRFRRVVHPLGCGGLAPLVPAAANEFGHIPPSLSPLSKLKDSFLRLVNELPWAKWISGIRPRRCCQHRPTSRRRSARPPY